MPQPTQEPAPWSEVQHSNYKGMIPACVSPGVYLVKRATHNVDCSYFAATHILHSSCCHLQLISQLGPLKISLLYE